jgi:hypothetical protein
MDAKILDRNLPLNDSIYGIFRWLSGQEVVETRRDYASQSCQLTLGYNEALFEKVAS